MTEKLEWLVYAHTLGELSSGECGRPAKALNDEGQVRAYMRDEGLREIWRETFDDHVDVHCAVEYRTLELDVRNSFKFDRSFDNWDALAAHMATNDLVFADGSEPCSSLAEFLVRADVPACADDGGVYGTTLRLSAIKRPR